MQGVKMRAGVKIISTDWNYHNFLCSEYSLKLKRCLESGYEGIFNINLTGDWSHGSPLYSKFQLNAFLMKRLIVLTGKVFWNKNYLLPCQQRMKINKNGKKVSQINFASRLHLQIITLIKSFHP